MNGIYKSVMLRKKEGKTSTVYIKSLSDEKKIVLKFSGIYKGVMLTKKACEMSTVYISA